jgi:alpha-glucuronidase
MGSGRTLWEELCRAYDDGASAAETMRETWRSVESVIDAQPHREVAARLDIQARDARDWCDQCLSYFGSFSGMPIPPRTNP